MFLLRTTIKGICSGNIQKLEMIKPHLKKKVEQAFVSHFNMRLYDLR
jgi:hypothetical protein